MKQQTICIIYTYNYGSEDTKCIQTFNIPEQIIDAENCVEKLKNDEDVEILHVIIGEDLVNDINGSNIRKWATNLINCKE